MLSTSPLFLFFDRVYCPLALRHRSAGYVEVHRGAIRSLAKAIGREPTLADLTHDRLAGALADLSAAGLGRLRLKGIRNCWLRVWKYAAELGLSAPCEPPRLPDSQTGSRAWNDSPPADGTLLAYYRRTFRPQLVAEPRCTQQMRARYDGAITALHDFAGRQLRLDEVTPDLVGSLRKQLADGGRERLAREHSTALRRVLRSADPARWPLYGGAKPKRPIARELEAGITTRPRTLPEPSGEPGTLPHFYATIYKRQALAHVSDQHRGNVCRLLRLLRSCFGRDLQLSELSGETLATFVEWLGNSRGLVTTKNVRGLLLSLWRFANDQELAPPVPRVRRIRIPRQAPDAWSLDELNRIIAASRRIDRLPIAGIPADRWWPAVLLTGWYTGLRRKSLLRLKPENIDLAARWINVPAGAMKNFVGQRFRIGQDAADAIREIFDSGRERLFAVDCDENNGRRLGEHFRQILQIAGVPKSLLPNGQFHKLRRTCATHVAASAGLAAASALLGHSSADLLKRYIDPRYIVGNDATAYLPSLAVASPSGALPKS